MNTNTVETEKAETKANTFKDYRNPMLSESEMTLRQFGSVSELLCKLKSDLKLSYGRYENTLYLLILCLNPHITMPLTFSVSLRFRITNQNINMI